MPREPNKEKAVESHNERSENESDGRKPGDYYYDDAHGYENYDPANEADEEEFED